MYFITICTNKMINHFGKIFNDKVVLNKIGKYTEQCWIDIPNHFKIVELDEYVIMPNHIHGIIVINKDNNVETQNFASLPNKFGPQSKNLGSIIRGFKIGVTKYANKNNIPFKWQARYHDRIIRDEKELYNVKRYIIENPLKWHIDKYYNE